MNVHPQDLLLCTDLDRTVIPNGSQPEHPSARLRFRRVCASPHICLVYVSGRHPALVEQAVADFALPVPDYVITDVGTRIYRIDNHGIGSDFWRELSDWREHIDQFWHGKTAICLHELLADIAGLKLQEEEKQSRYKLSYYLALSPDDGLRVEQIRARLQQAAIAASVVWSVDEPNAIGLIDILPLHATKLDAIEFLQQKLGYDDSNTVFAGDSGNDLEVLASHIPAVLVSNASDAVRDAAAQASARNGNLPMLYQASNDADGMTGNYSAGVLQGVWHFAPQLREVLEEALRNENAAA
jgi:HAD superfamily hydrolase (TIGR01484 family)